MDARLNEVRSPKSEVRSRREGRETADSGQRTLRLRSGQASDWGEGHSLAPAVVAGGVTLLLFGLSAGGAIAAAGALLVALGVAAWIGELRPPPADRGAGGARRG